jgi:origin recognition complex subunit 3
VRLRSGDATNLKATLRKIIKDVTTPADDDDDQVAVSLSGRKYLNYDLEALREYITAQERCEHVFIAFQDSEGFDSSLLSDLVVLFSNWRPQIPFTLLFGVATSVELLQARLLKSACEHLYGSQFDVVQSDLVLERVIKKVVAAANVPLRIGPSLLSSLVTRQEEQVVGIQAFISSLKYAYMCHFYANPLSVFMAPGKGAGSLQDEHYEGLRSLPSFQDSVEEALTQVRDPRLVRSLLNEADNAESLVEKVAEMIKARDAWIRQLLHSARIVSILSLKKASFASLYIDAMANGFDAAPEDPIFESLRKMESKKIVATMQSVKAAFEEGDEDLHLCHGPNIHGHGKQIEGLIAESESLLEQAEQKGEVLRSKYNGQTKVLRATVIAQKVQLSQDSAALTKEDMAFTKVVDEFVDLLRLETMTPGLKGCLFHEVWSYDSKAPYRDVFVPRPRGVFERGLTQPQDYLGCSCCGKSGGVSAKAPATCVLYRLYQEGGSLVNVADLWSAFYGVVGANYKGRDGERKALAQFYRGLAELKALGFVKPSKKKTDHVGKLKWL